MYKKVSGDINGCQLSTINCQLITISHRKRKQERTVDALALGGDEGRGKLR